MIKKREITLRQFNNIKTRIKKSDLWYPNVEGYDDCFRSNDNKCSIYFNDRYTRRRGKEYSVIINTKTINAFGGMEQWRDYGFRFTCMIYSYSHLKEVMKQIKYLEKSCSGYTDM